MKEKQFTMKFLRQERKILKNYIRIHRAKKLNRNYEYSDNAKKPFIMNNDELIKEIIENKKSLVRFGDGEFNSCLNLGITFQKKNAELANELKKILKEKQDFAIVGIPNIFGNIDHLTETLNLKSITGKQFWQIYLTKNNKRKKIYNLLNFNIKYADSFISRPYKMFKDPEHPKKVFRSLKSIWKNKNIVFIEGEFSRLGIGNDLFNEAKSIKRILAPARDAFDKRDEIIKECMKQNKEDTLFLLALGPTATVIAYDLAKIGYQALDIGHIDIEYEWFKQKATNKVAIKHKYTNETSDGKNEEDLRLFKNKNYESQIIAKIL